MQPLCNLEEKNGVDLGPGYGNDHACATFIDYIPRDFQQQLVAALNQRQFFSRQANSSTDTGNTENELFLYFTLIPIPQVAKSM